MRISDWSSDVCSSDLTAVGTGAEQGRQTVQDERKRLVGGCKIGARRGRARLGLRQIGIRVETMVGARADEPQTMLADRGRRGEHIANGLWTDRKSVV